MPRATQAKPRKLHRALHLQHHRHTGKLLHARHTSYRGLATLIVVAGAFMIGLNVMARVTADTVDSFTLHIYASKPAPIPLDAAEITSPHDGDNVEKSSQIVSGMCPPIDPRGIIVLLDNGIQVGSIACDSSNQFSLLLVLTPGKHTFIARTYTITGDTGPDSEPVTITYTTPAPVTSSAQAELDAEEPNGPPLTLTIDAPFIVFGPGADAVWSGSITGGTLPYDVHINWGDDSQSDYMVTQSGKQQFVHRYTDMQSHLILLRVIDAKGRGITQDYAAVTPYRIPLIAATTPDESNKPFHGSTAIGAYGAYLLTIAVFGFLWIHAHPSYTYAPATIHANGPSTTKKRPPRTGRH